MQSANTPINKVLTQAATDPPPEVRSLSQLLGGSGSGHISCGSADELLLGLALAVQLRCEGAPTGFDNHFPQQIP